ncbi:NUDIX domain-containing protein [Nonomuraea phyllanthi]|uniref:NUDIX domain-containing protein n=1 Tax=Nonomuraea phyllanthi TaxID=2219224 RepID=A0A5C4VCZ0_9ACTN|nr:NUDIX domain-containing protein [Nonomuraea phyllanthi]
MSVLAASAIARRDGEVLLVRQRNAGDLGSEWDLPGGMVEDGELADEAVLREIQEETGLRADKPSRLLRCLARPGSEVSFWTWPNGLDREPCVIPPAS